MKKVPNWECLFVHRKQGLFLSVHVDDIEMAGKKHNMVRKKLMKDVDLDEPTSSRRLGMHSMNANRPKLLLRRTEKCSNHEFLLEQLKNYQGGKTQTKTVAWSYDMERHAQK